MQNSSGKGLVSIIIPTYNRAHLVAQAIESATNQTWANTEIIVVDDGSTDDTESVVSAFPRILYLRQTHKGRAQARNLGLSRATGEFVCSLDSDDLLNSDFLEKSLGAMTAVNADIAFANWRLITRQGMQIPSIFQSFYFWWDFAETHHERWRLMNPEQSRAMFLDSCVCPSSGIIYRKKWITGEWDPNLLIGDDWAFAINAVLNNPLRTVFTMEPLWFKRVTGDNVSEGRSAIEVASELWVTDCWHLYKRFRNSLSREERAKFTRKLAANSFSLLRMQLSTGTIAASLSASLSFMKAILISAYYGPIELVQKILSRNGIRNSSVRSTTHNKTLKPI